MIFVGTGIAFSSSTEVTSRSLTLTINRINDPGPLIIQLDLTSLVTLLTDTARTGYNQLPSWNIYKHIRLTTCAEGTSR
jgi:hypothetical protein